MYYLLVKYENNKFKIFKIKNFDINILIQLKLMKFDEETIYSKFFNFL